MIDPSYIGWKHKYLNQEIFLRKAQELLHITSVNCIQRFSRHICNIQLYGCLLFYLSTVMNKQYTVLPLDGAKCFTLLSNAINTLYKRSHRLKYSLS